MAFPFCRAGEGVGYVEIAVIGTTSNVYALGGGKDYLLIDSGGAATAADVVATLTAAGFSPTGCRAIVVTHGHSDHFGGLAELVRWCGAPVWAHAAAAANIEDHRGCFTSPASWNANLTPADWDSFFAVAGELCPVSRLIRDGDVLETPIGALNVLHTPGHERGAITLHHSDRRLAFVGDLVQGGIDASANWLGLFHDPAAQRASLRRIAGLKLACLFKGHRHPRCGGEVEAELASAADRVDRIETAVLDALASGQPTSLADTVRGVFTRVIGQHVANPPQYGIATIAAFLHDLSYRGRVRRNSDLAWELVKA